MKLASIDLRRVPGLPRDLQVDGFGPGLNVVVGPNGSGKSSLCRAVQQLLWPDSAPMATEIGARWRGAAEEPLRCELLRRDAVWTRDGGVERPALPASSFAPCYRLTVGDLLQEADETDRGIARSIRIRMAGGIDFLGARRPFELGPKTGFRERQQFDLARREHALIRQDFRRLGEDEDRLHDLRRRRDAALAAESETRLLARSLELAAARAAVAEAENALRAFPPDLDRLRGDEVEELQGLRERIAAARQEEEAAENRRREAKARFQATGLTTALDDATLRRWERGGQEIERLEEAADAARRRLRTAEAGVAQVLDGFGGGTGELESGWINEAAIRELEQELAKLEALRGERAGVERQLQVLGGETEAPSAEPLERATHLLRQWLAAPEPDPEAMPGPVVLAAGGLALVGGAVTAILVHPAAWVAAAVGAGLLASALFGAWRRRKEEPARARLGLDYQASQATQPPSWSRNHVQWLLNQLEADLQDARAALQQQQRKSGLSVELEEVEARIRAAEEARRGWCRKLGLTPEAADGGLLDFARRLDRYRSAVEEHAKAQEQRRQLDEERRTLLAKAKAWLASVGEEAVEDGAGLAAACARLIQRNREFDRSSEALARARGEVQEARERLEGFGEAVEGLFRRCKLDPGEDRELARRVERLDAWREACALLQRESWTCGEKAKALDGHAAYLELDAEAAQLRIEETRRTAAEQRELTEAILGIEKELELQRGGSRLEEAEGRLEGCLGNLAEALERVIEAEAGLFLMDEVEEEFQEHNLPAVLLRAQEWFGRFTDHRWSLRLRRGAEAEWVAWDNQAEREHGLGELSDGTRVQLLLAARLAFALENEDGEELPFFLDEALSTADPRRFHLIAGALLELVRSGRQLLYLTANPADLAAWNRACKDAGAEPPVVIDLAAQRGEQAAVKDPAMLAPAPELEVPAPSGAGAAEYGVALQVPLPNPRQPVQALHLFHLLRDQLDGLHRLVRAGLRTVGQWQAIRGSAAGAGLLEEELDQRLEARVALAAAVLEAWRIGRGRPLDRAALEESEACGKFLVGFAEIAAEHDGDARALLDAIRERGDKRVHRFRSDKRDQLVAFLEEEGYFDPRQPLDEESLVTAALNAVATEVAVGRLDAGEVRRLVGELLRSFRPR
ncbi:MAG: hypothetical protein ISR76_05565 [Planctomycetes bacterium]|nr:hypothetical protein [Planctomycetota bacterium]